MILRAENISKKFPRKTGEANYFYAVNPLCLELEAGTLTVLVGRSGSGKTTLLNMLAGLISPSEGKVFLEDRDLYALPDKELSVLRNARIGVVPQGHTGLDSLTVLENVKLPYALYHKDDGADAYAAELLEKLDIAHLAAAYPSELSGGEVRRLAIARALVMKPDILLADEPTGDLDDENTETVLQLFREIADAGTAVLMVTHETGAEKFADRVCRMNAGDLTEEKRVSNN